MEKYSWFLDEMETVLDGINAEYMPTLRDMLVAHNISGIILNRCQMAQSEAPNPLTVEALKERAIYTNETAIAQSLVDVAEAGYLTAVSPTQYTLTEKGNAIANEIIIAINKVAPEIKPLPTEKLSQLAQYIIQLRDAAAQSDVPSMACLKRSMYFDQGESAPVIERIRRGLSDLAAFRDDVHIASWSNLGVSGPAWDAFSHIWGKTVYGDPVQTAEEIAEKMFFHGFSAEEYAAHLQTIVDNGWLTLEDGVYTVTDSGNAIRWQAERETDRLFFQSWNLSDDALVELKNLMAELKTAVQPPNLNELYQLMLDTRDEIGRLYAKNLREKIQELGLPNWGMLLLLISQSHHPNPINSATVLELHPYMNPEALANHLSKTAHAGFLEDKKDGYVLTKKGAKAITILLEAIAEWSNQRTDLPNSVLNPVYQTLNALSDTFSATDNPQTKPGLVHARALSPELDKPIFLRIGRAISEVVAFREDVHVAAFASYDVPAHVWEAFSHVWGENIWGERVNTAVDVSKKLALRGFDEATYTAALETAVQRGWLTKNSKNVYSLTKKGRHIRETAEQETDRLFFTPWQTFAPRELNALYNGLTQIKDALS